MDIIIAQEAKKNELFGEDHDNRPIGGWSYQSCDPKSFSPENEMQGYLDKPLFSYIEMHKPEIGDIKCEKKGDRIDYGSVQMRETLDFLTFSNSKYSVETDQFSKGELYNKFENCEKFD